MKAIEKDQLQDFIGMWLKEDVGSGDHSSRACISAGEKGRANLIIKEAGIISGLEVAKSIFEYLEPEAIVTLLSKDGEKVKPGQVVLELEASVHCILAGERLALNCLQRMSGVATTTHKLTQLIAHTKCKLLDTRKTTPGMRLLEKYAVHCGGGQNHRFGLYDMIMLKDNHIDFAGGVGPAIDRVRHYLKENQLSLKIEVESRDLAEVEEILKHGPVDRIMLDNYALGDIAEAIRLIAGRSETEASGGITAENIVAYAETGVDFISVGALTHSVKSLDMSLKAFD
ncbi:MAG: carboxylating nicotinate-nucleotide diphosphorylase [Cryomorphaceae bacterium]|nr:carboxylating nicotinate-nucleotide diphosphorylase [Cryomorphaceae bacterium]